jgi:pSer/pThr/pTyr-binding forkhead associated (FHA) protein
VELQAVIAAQRSGAAFLEYRDGDDVQRIIELRPERDRLSVGRLAACEVALTWDTEVSRAHALLEQVGGAWTVEDRGSSNGTLVNASRINGPHVLRDGDVLRIGRTQLIFHAAGDDDLRRTTPALDRVAPNPTESQRKVLVELCRPALERGGGAASNREIAQALFVSVETVKTHMRGLFDAFEVGDVPQYHKRTELVRRALETGLVTAHDLQN